MTAQEMLRLFREEAFEKLSEVLSGDLLEEAKDFYVNLDRLIIRLLMESGKLLSTPIGITNVLLVQEFVLTSCARYAASGRQEIERESC